ncbi:MAG TPA: hypothetical protein VG736_07985 [Vicinamibacterales bacterium]|jgi:uncharacterized ion transporter superfamily protein YfcC|nr:hypothetical protein [Vicinamibacterales bacterium]
MRHPLALLLACVLIAAAMTYVVPAGQFDRRDDPAINRTVVVPNSYHRIARSPVSPFQALVAIPRGFVDAAGVLAMVFMAGAAISVVDETGALRGGVGWIAAHVRRREMLLIPVSCALFGAGGAVEGMWEEIIAMMPMLMALSLGVGFDGLTAVSMSLGAAGIGAAFSPMNPFGVGIAQRFAEVPLLSGWPFRLTVLVIAMAIWAWGTMRYAKRIRTSATEDAVVVTAPLNGRHAAVLAATIAAFTTFVVGVLHFGWDFEQMAGVFLGLGLAAGLLGGLGIEGTSRAFVDGFRAMSYAALMIGVARAVFVVLDQGHIVDTIINFLVAPLSHLRVTLFAMGISIVQSLLTLPVPSSSGRVTLTMPIFVPLSDLLGLSRQVTVTATQFGPGVIGNLLPTDGALMAVLAIAGVPFARWLRFCLPLCAILFALALAAIAVAVGLNLQ